MYLGIYLQHLEDKYIMLIAQFFLSGQQKDHIVQGILL